MMRLPPRTTRTDTLFPYTTLFRSTAIAAPSYKVSEGEQFKITVPPTIEAQAAPQDIPLTIAYEDEHLIVVDKPAGLVVHPAAGNPDGTLVHALLHHFPGQLPGLAGVARPALHHQTATKKCEIAN